MARVSIREQGERSGDTTPCVKSLRASTGLYPQRSQSHSVDTRFNACPHHDEGVSRCRANMAHTRQSRPVSRFDVQVKILTTFSVPPMSLSSGVAKRHVSAFSVCP